MALKVKNFELSDGTIFENAYVRVQTVATANVDHEFIENLPDGNQIVRWKTKSQSSANIYVWPDAGARENRAVVQHWFKIDFEYDMSEWTNIYEQAYNKLKTLFPECEDC